MSLPETRPAGWSDLNDTQRAYWVLNNVGPEGRHSWDLANDIPSKNVSQRVKDLVSKGFSCFTVAERRNGRAGSRYWMGAANAPDHAIPVVANNACEADAGSSSEVPGPSATGRETIVRLGAKSDFGSAAASDEGADSGAVEKERPRLTLVWSWDESGEFDERLEEAA